MTSRVQNAARNYMWLTISNIVKNLLDLIRRTVFIYLLGKTFLGISGLFSNVIGILSLAELGISSVIGFSLYKPLAENDHKKVAVLMQFYKRAYQIIALVVSVLGLALIPALPYIAKGAEGIDHLTLIYLMFLADTVFSYLVSYKATLPIADQKGYLITNVGTVTNLCAVLVQILMLLITENYYIYLSIGILFNFINKITINHIVSKRYPYINSFPDESISEEEKGIITKKLKALIFHKIGDTAINQTDYLIMSSINALGIVAVGLASNYTLIITTINNYVGGIFSSAISGVGHMLATESHVKVEAFYRKYEFLAYWLYGFLSICFLFLLSPFMSLWLGDSYRIDNLSVFLLVLNFYLVGMRLPIGNVKYAAGEQEHDKWTSIVQAAVNLIVSILAAQWIGLPGIYLGTVISSIVPLIARPYVVYKYVFRSSYLSKYYVRFFKQLFLVCIMGLVTYALTTFFSFSNEWLNFAYILGVCLIVPNLILYLVFRKSENFIFLKQIFTDIFKRKSKKRG